MGQTLQIESNMKLYIGFILAYLHLTLAHSKVQDQGHAYFENLANGERILPSNRSHILTFDWHIHKCEPWQILMVNVNEIF